MEETEKVVRIALLTEYDGTDFVGFQRQNNGRSVQEALENAIFEVYGRFCRIYGCSRTDSGVHAKGHVSHVDVPFAIPEDKIPFAINRFLPADVAVLDAAIVSEDWHARFASRGKRYVYAIHHAPIRSPLRARTSAHVPGKLDIAAMSEACQYFVGTHDFSAFRAQGGPDISPIRTMKRVYIEEENHGEEVNIIVEGESFLYNMVRIMAGTIIYVGQGKLQPTDVKDLLTGDERKNAGKTMPAHGLTLERVFYDNFLFGCQKEEKIVLSEHQK